MKLMEMLKEHDILSLTRVMVSLGYLSFLFLSFYLAYSGKTWAHYETFASLACSGSVFGQLANKFINSKYNTLPGTAGKPIIEEDCNMKGNNV